MLATKKLLLIRHAKAVSEIGTSDFERPLKYSGLEDAAVMAERLKSHFVVPQLLISSTAVRTETTANIFAEHMALPKPQLDKNIYNADDETLIDLIGAFPEKYDFIGLVGHNPAISNLIEYFTGEMREASTCAVALIEFETREWKLLAKRTGKLAWFSSPKE